jgi:hypothetical protein
MTPPTQQSSAITLDPSALKQTGIPYANIKMLNPNIAPQTNAIPHDVIDEGYVENYKENHSEISNLLKDKNQTPPFSIQGYVENYKENHSEISC